MKPFFLLLTFCVLLVSCKGQSYKKNNSTKLKANSKIEIRRLNDTTESILFSFGFKNFNINELKKCFNVNVKVDSLDEYFEGSLSRTYKFFDNHSFISFFVKPYDKKDSYFYLNSASIINGFLKMNEGFDFDMDRKICFHKLGLKDSICDTLSLIEGDMAITYTFIFKESKLSKIEIESEQD